MVKGAIRKHIGVVITASHNPAHDNGVKIIDFNGHMLEQALEPLSEILINTPDLSLSTALPEVVSQLGLKEICGGVVLIGKDTRTSSEPLSNAVMFSHSFDNFIGKE